MFLACRPWEKHLHPESARQLRRLHHVANERAKQRQRLVPPATMRPVLVLVLAATATASARSSVDARCAGNRGRAGGVAVSAHRRIDVGRAIRTILSTLQFFLRDHFQKKYPKSLRIARTSMKMSSPSYECI